MACLVPVAEACSGPLMAACAKYVLPPLNAFVMDLLQKPIPPVDPPIPPVDLPIPPEAKMIPVGDLIIHDPDHKHSWEDKAGDTRFKETKLLTHASLSWEIKASISFDILSANKTYGVYLIFKRADISAGLDAVLTATVSTEIGDEPKDVCLSSKPKADADQKSGDIQLPVKSSYEEWMELELGEFLCSSIFAKRVAEISIKVKESGKHHMRGVYVAGIELRPKTF